MAVQMMAGTTTNLLTTLVMIKGVQMTTNVAVMVIKSFTTFTLRAILLMATLLCMLLTMERYLFSLEAATEPDADVVVVIVRLTCSTFCFLSVLAMRWCVMSMSMIGMK